MYRRLLPPGFGPHLRRNPIRGKQLADITPAELASSTKNSSMAASVTTVNTAGSAILKTLRILFIDCLKGLARHLAGQL
jgi:hypothetical protein